MTVVKSRQRTSVSVVTRFAYILCGPSGAGKGATGQGLLELYSHLARPISLTTRPQRLTEIPGQYQFVTRKKFIEFREAGELVTDTEMDGELYGYTKGNILRVYAEGKQPLMDVRAETIPSLKRWLETEGVCVRVACIDSDTLKEQLLGRNDGVTNIEVRLAIAEKERRDAQEQQLPVLKNVWGKLAETKRGAAELFYLC